MLHLQKAITVSAFAAAMAIASQASAHEVFADNIALPVIGSGDSYEVTVTCPHHHWVVSGGYSAGTRVEPNGPLVVSASYPSSTRSWTVEFTNESGRPTGAMEASASVYALCGSHPWH